MSAHFRVLRGVVWIALATCAGIHSLAADDGVVLDVRPTANPGELQLDWSGGYAPFSVYRDSAPAGVVDPGNLLGTTGAGPWLDVAPPNAIDYYLVTSPCVATVEICDGEDNDCDTVIDDGCPTCAGDVECPLLEHCSPAGTCVPDFPNGSACDDPDQCPGDWCVDGVCCDAACPGTCEACDVTPGACTPVPPGADPDDECGALDCSGYFFGWMGDTCFERADVSGATASCDGAGGCQTEADLCPTSGAGSGVLTCDAVCQAPVPASCSGSTPGQCADVDAGSQTCGLGICQVTVPRCNAGSQVTCVPGSPQVETCNDLDDNCDGTPDNGAFADASEPNDGCGVERSLSTVGSNQTVALTTANLFPSGDVDYYRFTALETDSTCSCCDFFCTDEDFRVRVSLTVPSGGGSYQLCASTSCDGSGPCTTVGAGTSGFVDLDFDGACGASVDSYTVHVRVGGSGAPAFECSTYVLSYQLIPGCY